jgi:hypothetical protein
VAVEAASRKKQLSGDRGHDHGRGHPNRDPSASDDHLHPTTDD